MAKSVLDILIKISKQGGADVETVKGLNNLKQSLVSAGAVAGAFVAVGYGVKKVLDETVGVLVEYADQVRRVQNATGASAEDSSKLIQILDDQKISYEQLEKAIAKGSKAYDFSINGIAGMSEEYLKLEGSQKQASFMQERFGKQWISFIPIMKQGKQAILDSADAVDENLILTQKAIVETRLWEIQMDNLSDTATGLKLSLGQNLLGAIDGSNWAIQKQAQGFYNSATGGKYLTDQLFGLTDAQEAAWQEALKQAEAEYVKANSLDNSTDATEDATASAEEYAAALKAASEANRGMLGLIGNIASETKSYGDKQAELTKSMQENRAEAALLYPWQKQQLDELNQKYVDMQGTYEQNAEAHRLAMGKIQYDLLITKYSVDGITDAEYLMAQQAGLMFGVFDQKSIETANNFNAVTQAVADGRLKIEDMQRALDMLPSMKSIDVVIHAITQMSSFSSGPSLAVHENSGNKGPLSGGFAGGGISAGPQSGHMELLHGVEAIVPLENGAIPVQIGSNSNFAGGGGDNYYLNFTIASPMTFLDQHTAQNILLPFIINGLREAKARGSIK